MFVISNWWLSDALNQHLILRCWTGFNLISGSRFILFHNLFSLVCQCWHDKCKNPLVFIGKYWFYGQKYKHTLKYTLFIDHFAAGAIYLCKKKIRLSKHKKRIAVGTEKRTRHNVLLCKSIWMVYRNDNCVWLGCITVISSGFFQQSEEKKNRTDRICINIWRWFRVENDPHTDTPFRSFFSLVFA